MSRKKDLALVMTGAVLGASLVGGAVAAEVMAEPNWLCEATGHRTGGWIQRVLV